MGASEWDYYVPHQGDLGAALDELRRRVFEAGDYWWVYGPGWAPTGLNEDRPRTLEEMWDDDLVQEMGTHSILDVFRVLGPDEDPASAGHRTVQPVSAEEAFQHLGTSKLTRAHVARFDVFPRWRWFGRCAILHDAHGRPQEIYFWGHSGD
ncbi:hypothetical protein [Streptomyces sp. NPDC002889]|uniref:hypothetical protein n=1 Tax=Streptomyces sp. NPDC002889 TaxID=3364669 RepID=UPI0036BCB4FE